MLHDQKIGSEFSQVAYLADLKFIYGLEIVPESVFIRILVRLRIFFDQAVSQQRIEWIEHITLINAALSKNLNYFSLLLLFQI